jgi:uncharacterized protein
MLVGSDPGLQLPARLGLPLFRPRFPWLTGDLQTVRDIMRPVVLPPDQGEPLPFAVGDGEQLLGVYDRPLEGQPKALVLLMHGVGASSRRVGLRRMGYTLRRSGFAVLRLNLRGAGGGRALARGTYAANSNRDLLPVLRQLRGLAGSRPLLGMGLSLGGTNLLNALTASTTERRAAGIAPGSALLDGLVTISSPIDLESCTQQMERPRNRLYQWWLLKRLVAQTLADPFGVSDAERLALQGPLASIRAFDAAFTAPRWGYASIGAYYAQASPLAPLLRGATALPPTLVVHAEDDPWVPVAPTRQLAEAHRPGLEVLLVPRGGHNGFHGRGGCWTDQLTDRWFQALLG